jgi:hypothetical protein
LLQKIKNKTGSCTLNKHPRAKPALGAVSVITNIQSGSLALRTVIKQWFMKDLGKIVSADTNGSM